MMNVGREKVKAAGLDSIISFQKEDCMHLSFPDNTFDAVTAAFGIRNFQDLDQGLREMCRVLKKGGHLSIAELTEPVHFPMKQCFKLYSHTFLPVYGSIISKDKSAYSYLTATIEAFSTRRADDGHPAKGWLLQGLLPATDLRNMHSVFRRKITITSNK